MKGKSANVRIAADSESELVGRMYNGETVDVLSEADGWYLVKGQSIERDEIMGYVSAKVVTLVAKDAEVSVEPEATPEPAATVDPTATPEPVQQAMTILNEGETELTMYAQADAEGEQLAAIPAGATLIVKEVGAEWTLVQYGEFTGYVPTSKIALLNPTQPETPDTEAPVVRSITVTSSIAGLTEVREGTVVTLTASLVGFEGDNVALQWQYTPDGGATILDAEGASGAEISYSINPDNAGYLWRLKVTRLNQNEDVLTEVPQA